jgi:hypothetical protein
MKSKDFGMRVVGNLMIGKGTFIKAPGYKRPIDAENNTQIGDGTFIDTTEEKDQPKESKGDTTSKSIIIDKLVLPVSAGLVLATLIGGFTMLRPRFGF